MLLGGPGGTRIGLGREHDEDTHTCWTFSFAEEGGRNRKLEELSCGDADATLRSAMSADYS